MRGNAFVIFCMVISCSFRATSQAVVPGRSAYSGLYVNPDYGFSVQIPKRISAEGAAPGAPNHGFLIRFSTDPNDYLGVDASYEVTEDSGERYQPEERASGRGVVRREGIEVAGVQGTRTVVRATSAKGDPLLLDVISVSRKASDPPIAYTISLKTKPSTYEARLRILTAILKSFRFLPLH